MMNIDIEKNYAIFKKWVSEFVLLGSPATFLKWLDTTDFKVAPASTKYHLNVEGGLCQHSLNVFKRLIKIMKDEYGDESNWAYGRDVIAMVGLLHGISKVGLYRKYSKNVRNDETGQWETAVAYTVVDDDKRLVVGNYSDNTLFILRHFFNIPEDAEIALRYYRGAFDADDWDEKNELSLAIAKCPLSLLLHIAELQSTYIDENDKTFNWVYDIGRFFKEDAEQQVREQVHENNTGGGEADVKTGESDTEATIRAVHEAPF